MKQSHISFVGLASLLLVAISSFAACGGLDPRKVTRGPDYSAGGDDSSGGTGNGTGNEPSAGGSDANGGEPNVNPFGGNFDLGGAPPVVDGPPEVVMVDPPDGAVDVDLNTNVSFLFNEAVNPDTVTVDSCTLSDDLGQVAGDVSLNQDVIATFEPPRRLALATTYTTAVSTDVTDTTGQALESEFSSTFTTRDGEWDVNQPFVADPGSWNYYTKVGLGADDRGNALVVWAAAGNLWARWHRQSTGWQAPESMSATFFDYDPFDVAVSPDGDAIVIFTEAGSVVSKRYVGGTWSATPEPIPGATNGARTRVAFKGGHAVAWWEDNSMSHYLYASTTTADGAWSASPAYINYAGSGQDFGYFSAIAMDSSGNAMLIHNFITSNVGQLYFSKYVAATGEWEGAAIIPGAAVNQDDSFSAALDDNGVAMVAWPTANADLMASRYTKAKGFGTATPLDELDSRPVLDAKSSVVTDGNDFVVGWQQTVGSTQNAYANRYSTAEARWLGVELVSNGDSSVYGIPVVAADTHGNVLIAWPQKSANAGPNTYEDVGIQFARWTRASSAWWTGDTGATPLGYNYVAIAGSANGVINVMSQDHGNYIDRPGQPFLHVFQ